MPNKDEFNNLCVDWLIELQWTESFSLEQKLKIIERAQEL